jgi:asparagine synthase (glutamine-hydrolysing)
MCGIAGLAGPTGVEIREIVLRRMAAVLDHRGPDAAGMYLGNRAGLAHTRLSIIDLESGDQPLFNEGGNVAITYNGEVYNYIELRRQLEDRGHVFRTHSDTESIVHAYEEWGNDFPSHLNGQFACAIYDERLQQLVLVRDRFGVRPLFYSIVGDTIYFASEVKALFASGAVEARPDLRGLDEIFTFWGARAPRTPFLGVHQLEPGTMAVWRDDALEISRYYAIDYPEAGDESTCAIRTLDDLMRSSVAFRLRSDVPVGAYLSGGLDSSITSALAAARSPHQLRTFSVTFDDARYDERAYQQLVADALHTQHHITHIQPGDIARVFPDVVYHAETPMLRTAPAPLYLLAKLAREQGITVVLTGEGSDELFLGYDLFKETSVREFCMRQPQSTVRPHLFDRMYHYMGSGRAGDLWRKSFLEAGGAGDPLFSHLPRFLATSRIKAFFSPETRAALDGFDAMHELRESLPASYVRWSSLNKAAYLEMTTLLSSYLLSTQGERMSMAHGVEGRFPFLDHRLFEFSARLPASSKLLGLKEKEILKRWARPFLPNAVVERVKQPYRAPDVDAFAGVGTEDYLEEVLSESAVRRLGLFDSRAVAALAQRARCGRVKSVSENQAFVGILSTQLWAGAFLSAPIEAVPRRECVIRNAPAVV